MAAITSTTISGPVTVRARAGIDCAITAPHRIELVEDLADGTVRVTRQAIESTAAGMDMLTDMLTATGVVVDVVAEPTSLTWVGIQAAVGAAGGRLFLIGTKHSARLRAAVAGKNKSDVIDAHLLAKALDVFDLSPMHVATPGQEAIKRTALARTDARKELDRCWRRLRSYVAATVPDIDKILAGRRNRMIAVLARWPDIRALSHAKRPTIAAALRQHSYCRGTDDDMAIALRDAAAAWVRILTGYYDLDFHAIKITNLLVDIEAATRCFDRYTDQLDALWHTFYGDDELLLSVPGTGPITAATIRGWLGDASRFPTAATFASYCGFAPSNWSSGTMEHQHRAINKEGPAPLRAAIFLAANAARRSDPQLAATYHRLMTERGAHHNKAVCAVARKLAERIWIVIRRGQQYQYRNLDGTAIAGDEGRVLVRDHFTVSDTVRAQHRSHTANRRRARLAA